MPTGGLPVGEKRIWRVNGSCTGLRALFAYFRNNSLVYFWKIRVYLSGILDLWYVVLGSEQYTVYWQRGMACVFGILITSLAIAFFLRTYLPQEAYEMFVKDVTDTYQKDMTKVKWLFDLSALLIAVVLMLVLFRRFAFNMVGLNTVLATIVNAPLIGFFGKMLDRAGSFDSSFPEFYQKFQKIMN